MCVFEGSIPPSISVTKKQEVWGEYGMYTAHEQKFLFKIIHKRQLKISKKEIQILTKSSRTSIYNTRFEDSQTLRDAVEIKTNFAICRLSKGIVGAVE